MAIDKMVHNPLSEMTVNDKAEFISQKHAAKKGALLAGGDSL